MATATLVNTSNDSQTNSSIADRSLTSTFSSQSLKRALDEIEATQPDRGRSFKKQRRRSVNNSRTRKRRYENYSREFGNFEPEFKRTKSVVLDYLSPRIVDISSGDILPEVEENQFDSNPNSKEVYESSFGLIKYSKLEPKISVPKMQFQTQRQFISPYPYDMPLVIYKGPGRNKLIDDEYGLGDDANQDEKKETLFDGPRFEVLDDDEQLMDSSDVVYTSDVVDADNEQMDID